MQHPHYHLLLQALTSLVQPLGLCSALFLIWDTNTFSPAPALPGQLLLLWDLSLESPLGSFP